MLNYQLFFEIKKVGLENDVDFELLEPVIDKNGYDILIKHHKFCKPIQLKCAERNGTQSWKINKRFFRPADLIEAKTVIFNPNASHIGLGGGVILIEYFVNEDNNFEIKYFYSDFVYLSFFQRSVKSWNLQSNYCDFISGIFDDTKRKISLPKSLFVEVSIQELLYLSRILPVSNDLNNLNTWLFNYPPIDEINLEDRLLKEKSIKVLLNNGDCIESSLQMYDIFDYGLRNYPIVKDFTI